MPTVIWRTAPWIILPKTFTVLTSSKVGEIYYESLPKNLKLNEFFKIFIQHYVSKMNHIIASEISDNKNDFYDEVLVFQLNSVHIELLNYPIFTLQSRDDKEWFEYIKDANRILKIFKENYFWKKEDQIFNTPILLEEANGTEFDIMIVIDTGYIVFLNKKNAVVSQEELKKYESLVQDMIYGMREKILSLL